MKKKKIWIIIIAVTVILITLIVITTTFLHSIIVKTITDTDDKGGYAKYDEENFNYPAYAMVLGYDLKSEYALLDEENYTIIYVYVEGLPKSLIRFNYDYLPKGYREYGDCNEAYIYDDNLLER